MPSLGFLVFRVKAFSRGNRGLVEKLRGLVGAWTLFGRVRIYVETL